MNRNLSELQNNAFDLVIVGGGITGACLATDAAMRGLSVALVEKGDFGAATSSASSKLLHGGIRYLQQLNFIKVYESAKERIYFQQLAPHLTYYVPFIIPTYTSFTKGKFVMRSAMKLFEIICAGQNNIISDASKRVPASKILSRQDVKQVVPDLQLDNITGGVVFYESHMYSSERMTLGFVETAQQHGASVANYLEVESLLGADKGCVRGVRVKDQLNGESFDIHSALVVNAAGPWIPTLNNNIGQSGGSAKKVEGVVNAFSKGAHIITRQLTQGHAVALPTKKQNQAVINRGGRHVFIIPWRGYSLIGTTYRPYKGDLNDVYATENDIDEMIGDINSALVPNMGIEVLCRDDVLHAFAGIYPLIDDVINTNVYQGTGKYQIVDHAKTDKLDGLVSVFGAKFTTARLLAEKALDQIAPRFDKKLDRCKTRNSRLVPGNIEDIQLFREEQKSRYSSMLAEPVINNLVTNYGANIHRVTELIEADKSLAEELVPDRQIVAAEIVYAARHEMACHLDDFVFRRTGLGTLGSPGEEVLRHSAMLMAQELGWDQNRIDREVEQTLSCFPVDQQKA
ncbi:MAG: glycerol-3-phosphate dehydrogenase/oxidase [Gammaproteobacteria bacterium]|nr:glycerol-3-phosphate dehydrogenase/oxidase [Gammaproteobacteria bacterium]